MKKWYKKDQGKTILYGESEEVTVLHPSAIEIPNRPTADSIWDEVEGIWKEDPEAYRRHRAKAYPPVGDQLDAIWKQLAYMQMNQETNLVVDADAIMVAWLRVKQDYPKPS